MPALDPTKAWVKTNLKHPRQLTRCRFSPCGRFLIGAGLESTLYRWELATEQVTQLPGHSGWVYALAFDPDGKRLYSSDSHGTIRCWSHTAAVPALLWSKAGACAGAVRTLTTDRSGRVLLAGGCNGELRMFSNDGMPLGELAGHQGHVFSSAAHPDGKSVVTGDLFGKVRQWDLASRKCVRELNAGALHTRQEDFIADVGGVRSFAFNAAGTHLACGGLTAAESNTFCPGTPTVLVLDWATGKLERQLNATSKTKVDGFINAVRYLADGTLCGYAEGASSAALWFWRPGDAEAFYSIAGPSGYDLDLHPDGVTLAAALYENRGHSGNGRRAKSLEEYTSNAGVIRLWGLHAKGE